MASANLHLARLDPRMSLHLSPDDWDLHTDLHLQKSKSIHSASYACFKHVKNPLILSNQYSCVPRCLFTPFKCRSPVQLAGSLCPVDQHCPRLFLFSPSFPFSCSFLADKATRPLAVPTVWILALHSYMWPDTFSSSPWLLWTWRAG